MKQECALAEKEFKILKLKDDIKRVEQDINLQSDSIEKLKQEIKDLEQRK